MGAREAPGEGRTKAGDWRGATTTLVGRARPKRESRGGLAGRARHRPLVAPFCGRPHPEGDAGAGHAEPGRTGPEAVPAGPAVTGDRRQPGCLLREHLIVAQLSPQKPSANPRTGAWGTILLPPEKRPGCCLPGMGGCPRPPLRARPPPQVGMKVREPASTPKPHPEHTLQVGRGGRRGSWTV